MNQITEEKIDADKVPINNKFLLVCAAAQRAKSLMAGAAQVGKISRNALSHKAPVTALYEVTSGLINDIDINTFSYLDNYQANLQFLADNIEQKLDEENKDINIKEEIEAASIFELNSYADEELEELSIEDESELFRNADSL